MQPTPQAGDRPGRRRLPLATWIVYPVGLVPAVWTFSLGVPTQRTSLGPSRSRRWSRSLASGRCASSSSASRSRPLRQMVGVNLLRYRRAVRLLAFYYVALHLLAYVVLDQGLD